MVCSIDRKANVQIAHRAIPAGCHCLERALWPSSGVANDCASWHCNRKWERMVQDSFATMMSALVAKVHHNAGRGFLAAVVGAALCAAWQGPVAYAQGAGTRTAATTQSGQLPRVNVVAGQQSAPTNSKVARPYYVEFRSRAAQSYGHTFLIHGRVAEKKITEANVAGLHPFTESPVPWMVGHLVLVPSETGASDGDTEEVYVTARYRVLLTEAEYKKTLAFIRHQQASSPVWHAVLYNCNAWVMDVAAFMGLKTPGKPSTVLLKPQEFITNLKEINGGRPFLDPSFASAPSNAYARGN